MNTTFLRQPDCPPSTAAFGSRHLPLSTVMAYDLYPSGVPGGSRFGDQAPARRLPSTAPAPQLQPSGRRGPQIANVRAYRFHARLATLGLGNGDGGHPLPVRVLGLVYPFQALRLHWRSFPACRGRPTQSPHRVNKRANASFNHGRAVGSDCPTMLGQRPRLRLPWLGRFACGCASLVEPIRKRRENRGAEHRG